MSQLLDDLKAVDNLLNTDEHWIQGTWAKCSMDQSVPANNPSAISWCLEGAIYYVLGIEQYGYYPDTRWRYEALVAALRNAFPKKFQGLAVPNFNDNGRTTFRVVKNAIQRAIQKAEEQEAMPV